MVRPLICSAGGPISSDAAPIAVLALLRRHDLPSSKALSRGNGASGFSQQKIRISADRHYLGLSTQ